MSTGNLSKRDIVFDPKVCVYGDNFRTSIKIPNIPNSWSIGVIYGPSGTGKTTILKTLFTISANVNEIPKDDLDTPTNEDSRPIDILHEDLLIAVGMKSIPSWYTPIKYLSGGERERFDCGVRMYSAKSRGTHLLLDEFTSLVDRSTAMGMSRGISKWCKLNDISLVVATIHKDILPYLSPTWVWSTRLEKFLHIPAPKDFDVTYTKGKNEDWNLFSKYHYLCSNINPACNIYIAHIEGDIVGFISLLGHFGGGKRIHRLVIFPEWQGLGIGPRILEDICKKEADVFPNIYIKTSHPSMGRYLNSSPHWEPTSRNNKKVNKTQKVLDNWETRKETCWCYKFVMTPDIRDAESKTTDIKYKDNGKSTKDKGCLKYVGKIVKSGDRVRYIRKRHPVKYFNSLEEAEEARYRASAECYDTYEIKGDNVVVNGKFSVNKRNLDLLRGYRWHIRYNIVFKWEDRKRVSLSDITTDDVVIL